MTTTEPRRVYFRWMGAYWSCSPKVWERIKKAADNFQAIELNSQVTQLKHRPNTQIEILKENR